MIPAKSSGDFIRLHQVQAECYELILVIKNNIVKGEGQNVGLGLGLGTAKLCKGSKTFGGIVVYMWWYFHCFSLKLCCTVIFTCFLFISILAQALILKVSLISY